MSCSFPDQELAEPNKDEDEKSKSFDVDPTHLSLLRNNLCQTKTKVQQLVHLEALNVKKKADEEVAKTQRQTAHQVVIYKQEV